MINRKGFTLVELIVVITILAILGTLAFVSFQNYVSSARDSKRVTDIKNINKQFGLHVMKGSPLPIPEDSVEITANERVINYQGYAGEKVLNMVGVGKTAYDPITKDFFTYVRNQSGGKYQIMGFLENGLDVAYLGSQVHANNAERFSYSKGQELGVIFTAEGDILQKTGTGVNLSTTDKSLEVVFSGTKVLSGTGQILQKAATVAEFGIYSSCSELLEKNPSARGKSGKYFVSFEQGIDTQVYCDMEVEDGGWTMLAAVPGDSEKFANKGTAGIWKSPYYTFETPGEYNDVDYLSEAYEKLTTNEVLLCYKDNTKCYNFQHNKNIPLYNFYRDNISHVEYSQDLIVYGDQGEKSNLEKYFSTMGLPYDDYGCKFLGLNYIVGGKTYTNLVAGYGSDGDGPCISRNNTLGAALDNKLLGVSGYLRYMNTKYIETRYLPGYQYYPLEGSIKIEQVAGKEKVPSNLYLSDSWYLLGK